MPKGASQLALIPLLAVTVALGATGIHGRRTHDPDRAAHAVEILAPTTDEPTARFELDDFFESGWVDWAVKTRVEFACGTVRGRNVADPVGCVARAHAITYDHECREREVFRGYTWLAGAALLPLLTAMALGASILAALAAERRKRPAA